MKLILANSVNIDDNKYINSFNADVGLPLVDISQLMKEFYSENEFNTVEVDPISNIEISDYAVKYQGIQYQFDAVSKAFLVQNIPFSTYF